MGSAHPSKGTWGFWVWGWEGHNKIPPWSGGHWGAADLPPASPPAMVELDGDDIRISSRGKVAERDIVQVPTDLTNEGSGDPLPAHLAGWWWGVPWGPRISPVTPGVHWVELVWRDDKVDWDMGQHWDLGGTGM